MCTRQAGALRTIALLALALLALRAPTASHAQRAQPCGAAGASAGAIVLDGLFDDWAGQPCVPDPVDDCENDRTDLTGFFFATSPDGLTAYFMAKTAAGASQPLGLQLRIDADNDGAYSSAVDRTVLVRYHARGGDSRVDVDLLDGAGQPLAQIARAADWGESLSEGGDRVEWGLSLAQLGVQAGQPIRMRLDSRQGSPQGGSPCDTSQEVQWSPADALGPALLLVIVLGVAAVAARLRGRLA